MHENTHAHTSYLLKKKKLAHPATGICLMHVISELKIVESLTDVFFSAYVLHGLADSIPALSLLPQTSPQLHWATAAQGMLSRLVCPGRQLASGWNQAGKAS